MKHKKWIFSTCSRSLICIDTRWAWVTRCSFSCLSTNKRSLEKNRSRLTFSKSLSHWAVFVKEKLSVDGQMVSGQLISTNHNGVYWSSSYSFYNYNGHSCILITHISLSVSTINPIIVWVRRCVCVDWWHWSIVIEMYDSNIEVRWVKFVFTTYRQCGFFTLKNI